MGLIFITGNQGKLREIQAIIPDVEQLDVDLDELQDTSAKAIIAHKLAEARRHHAGELMVEDTSLHCDGLGGLPGPLIKWFLKSLGADGLAAVIAKVGNPAAQAKTMIGYAAADGQVSFFEGAISGRIVAPRGQHGFGWDVIFQPDGHDRTFAEMTTEEKNQLSMRRRAAQQLQDFRDRAHG